jgi:hypothetical protein
MGNLDLDKRYSWEPADYEVSKLMQAYFVNFIKTANPNGPGLPNWPASCESMWSPVLRPRSAGRSAAGRIHTSGTYSAFSGLGSHQIPCAIRAISVCIILGVVSLGAQLTGEPQFQLRVHENPLKTWPHAASGGNRI